MTQHSARSTQSSLVGAAVAVVAAAVYSNALANGLVWDDPIILNRQLLAFQSFGDVLFPPRNIPQYAPDYYRPLTTLSYLIDHALGGTGALMFHFSVVLGHVVATYLVFRFARRLFADAPGAVAAAGYGAALFAVHPIHSESVAWGAGRSDVLATCFVLAAALAWLNDRWAPMRRGLVAASLLFLAMTAKETAVAALLLIPALDLVHHRGGSPPAAPRSRGQRRRQQMPVARPVGSTQYLPIVAALLLYLGLRYSALGTMVGTSRPLDAGALRQMVAAVGLYMGKLVLPVSQCAYISELPTDGGAFMAIALLLIVWIGAFVMSWRRGARQVGYLLLWIGVTLAPSLSIVLKIPNAPVAERYLYLPSVGFCLLVGYGVSRLYARLARAVQRTAFTAVCGGILAVAAVATVQRNAVWRSNLTLWQDTARKNSTDGLPMRNLGTAQSNAGNAAQAAASFQLALQRRNDPIGLFTIHNNLGAVAMQAKQIDAAEQHYRTALGIDPNAADCLYNLALIALTRAVEPADTQDADAKRAHAVEARKLFERAAQLSPFDTDIQIGLGQTLSALGDPNGARRQYQHALQLGVAPNTEAAVRRLLAELP